VGLAKERESEAAVAAEAPAAVALDVTRPEMVEAELPPAPEPPAEPPADEPKRRGRPKGPKNPTKAEAQKLPDRVFLAHAKDAILIRPNSAEMFILQHLRDEAHRFAVTFHRSQRKRLTLRSALAEIPGIGEGRQRILLRFFGSVKKIREASLEDLAGVPGMTRAAAVAVCEHWKRHPAPPEDPALSVHVAVPSGPPSDDAEEDAMDSAFADVDADDDDEEAAPEAAAEPQA
jgi:hypothetical protein